MTKRLLSTCWLLLPLLGAALVASAAPVDLSKAYRERRALVIGINAYRHWTPLNSARGDAEAVGRKLEALGFRVDYLLDGQATRDRIIERLGALQSEVEERDQVLVYFSGHGDTREAGAGQQKRRLGYLVPADGDPRNPFTAISMETLRELSGLLQARHVMFALDACFSGTLLTERGPAGVRPKTDAFYQEALAKRVRFVLTAGTAGQKAVEVDGHGLFTRQLLRALEGAADPASRDGVLTGLDIATFVRKTVTDIARERYGRRQTPVFGYMEGQGDGEFLLLTRAVASVSPPPPPPPVVKVVPEFGGLVIRSPREPVEVFFGEQRLGVAGPSGALDVDRLPVGSHSLSARALRQGFKAWERRVQVAANQRVEVVIDIEPLRPEPPRADDGAEMVLVPAGEFWMGSDTEGGADERPRHRVHLDAYHIDKHEVTNALYKRFMEATGRSALSYWNDARFNGSSQPVVGVSWHDADAYCKWAGKRLPTEAEWEKAARGADSRKYPWGDQWDSSRANAENKLGKTAPVGSYSGGVSPYGAHDMAGNVWEWVADWYDKDYYKRSPERNPTGPDSGTTKVLRGGSWNFDPIFLRSSNRLNFMPDVRNLNFGFRCARGS